MTARLHRALEKACADAPVDCTLLSGGVDSSLLAHFYRRPAITVALKGRSAPDSQYAQRVAGFLRIPHLLIEVDEAAALRSLCSLMLLVRNFDRGLFNELPVFWALSTARQRGWRRIASGQGAEILFAGYAFMVEMGTEFSDYRRQVLRNLRLAETKLARALGAEMVYPLLSPVVVHEADRHDLDDCIARSTEPPVSKMPLRAAADRVLPPEIAWRPRADLEFGSGFTDLGDAAIRFSALFPRVGRPCRRYWDDAHEAFHRIFVGLGLTVPPLRRGCYGCSWCDGAVALGKRHCETCGAYPADSLRDLTT